MTDDQQLSPAVATVVREIEAYVATAGWDQPPRLFALVDTEQLLGAQPALAGQIDPSQPLTSIEQEDVPAEAFEEFLTTLSWPPSVAGCAAVVERLVLPPEADAEMPEDPAEAAEYAASHPGRHEVRMVGAVTRDGEGGCALRLRDHDEDAAVVTGPDLVPRLLELLAGTLESDPEGPDE